MSSRQAANDSLSGVEGWSVRITSVCNFFLALELAGRRELVTHTRSGRQERVKPSKIQMFARGG